MNIDHHLQNAEYDLLRYLIKDEHLSATEKTTPFLNLVAIDEKVFTEPCRGIYEKILKLRTENRAVNYLSLKNEGATADQIISISSTETLPLALSYIPDVLEAYNCLSKAYLWREYEKMKQDFTDPTDYFEAISTLEIKNFASLQAFRAAVDEYLKQKGEHKEAGIITNWPKFNNALQFQKGEMTIIGARTSIGKTSFALNLAIQTASLGFKTLFVTMEMTKHQVMDKIGGVLLKKPVNDFKKGHFDFAEYIQESASIAPNFQLEYVPGCKTKDVEKLIQHTKPEVVVVDYLQLLRDEGKKGDTETNRLGKISGKLKELAGKYNLLMVVPAQLNRDSEKQNREPRVSDLRDSGNIEQDADQVLLLHRDTRASELAKLIIAKHRTGEVQDLMFDFFLSTGIFAEL